MDGPCVQGVCGAGGACQPQAVADGTICDDGNACTTDDACTAGTCGGSTKDCSALADDCNSGTCNATSGECEAVPANQGGACEDDDACTTGTTCTAGACGGGTAVDCTALDSDCSTGICNPDNGECQAEPTHEGEDCDDGDACTQGEACSAGECTGGEAPDCTDFDGACSLGECNPSDGSCEFVPINEGLSCADSDLCTEGDICTEGVCAGAAVDCSAFADACHDGVCDPGTGDCEPQIANQGDSCDDDAACTSGEVCVDGVCGALPATGLLLSDGFADNSAGWALGTGWSIGSATASSGQSAGTFPDPAGDHTAGSGNGIAGVFIGGNVPLSPREASWLTSSEVDLSTAAGSVYLSYWRHLNSDFPPWMSSRVEVWDGTEWQVLYANVAAVADDEWTFQQHDVTAYKNAGFQVRFGFWVSEVDDLKAVSSWNLDDIAITTGPCDASGNCTSGIPDDCSGLDDGECLVGMCSEGLGGACESVPVAEGTPCGGQCSAATCNGAGSCVGALLPDGDDCTHPDEDSCNPATCQAGVCTLATEIDGSACSTGDPCMAGVCESGACVASAVSDGTSCPTASGCQIGTCLGGTCEIVQAEDGTACAGSGATCTVGRCSAGTCVDEDAPDGTACSDGLACTDSDTCVAGACTAGGATDCSSVADDCNIGLCDETQGGCYQQPANEDDACDDGSSCTSGEICGSGFCSEATLGCTCAAGETAVVVTAADLPLAIGDLATTTSDITVSASGTVTKIVVKISATHTRAADLNLTLLSPAATDIVLSSGNGATGDNYASTIFDDDATVGAQDADAPFTGVFDPEDPLVDLVSESAAGDWTLSVQDTASGETGTLTGFSIAFCLAP